jgi:hypothetical protein
MTFQRLFSAHLVCVISESAWDVSIFAALYMLVNRFVTAVAQNMYVVPPMVHTLYTAQARMQMCSVD